MPPKKTTKKITKKKAPMKRKVTKKSDKSEHFHFLTILVLFAGFTVYALFSFFNSTNQYLDNYQASVIDSIASPDLLASVPPDCQTCPPFPICASVCAVVEDVEEEEEYEIFSDVTSKHRHARAIETLYNTGIINGYTDGSFKAENTLNRAELLTVLTNAIDADFSGGSYDHCFTDVETEWFAPFVCYAKQYGWVNGFEDGSYRPSQTVNRAEALKIVLETFEFEIPEMITQSPFSDVHISEWFAPYAQVAKENAVIADSAFFSAGYELSRAEFVQMVYNAMVAKGLL